MISLSMFLTGDAMVQLVDSFQFSTSNSPSLSLGSIPNASIGPFPPQGWLSKSFQRRYPDLSGSEDVVNGRGSLHSESVHIPSSNEILWIEAEYSVFGSSPPNRNRVPCRVYFLLNDHSVYSRMTVPLPSASLMLNLVSACWLSSNLNDTTARP